MSSFTSSLPSIYIRGDKCSLTKSSEFVQIYGGPISALVGTTITAGTVVWQGKDHKKDMKEFDSKIASVRATTVGSSYAMMKCFSGDKKMMNKWMEDIAKAMSGQDCAAVKDIPKAATKA